MVWLVGVVGHNTVQTEIEKVELFGYPKYDYFVDVSKY